VKKYCFFLLVCVLIFSAGCGKTADAPPTETTVEATAETTLPPETTEETIPVPQTVCGTARVLNTPAVLSTKMRGDQVDVVGEYDENHYVVKTAEGYGLVRREFVRMEGEPAYENWTGYARWNAELYTNLYLSGEPAQKLITNTEVMVLDDLGYCFVVQVEETVGFIKPERISKWRISSGGSGDDEGGGGGGGSGGGGGGGGQDGGDISLRYHGSIQLLAAIEQKGEVTGTGTILADGAEVILGYFVRGEEIPVVTEEGFAESKEGFRTIYLDGLYAWVEENLVCMDDTATTFEAWDGYARWSAVVYDNIHLIGTPKDKLNTNTKIHVVDELDNCYLVEIEEVPGFMAKNMVSKWRYSSSSSGDDGGGGGGDSGGGGGGAEWTPPAL
jgi:uncharacterized membrane protein YgcG